MSKASFLQRSTDYLSLFNKTIITDELIVEIHCELAKIIITDFYCISMKEASKLVLANQKSVISVVTNNTTEFYDELKEIKGTALETEKIVLLLSRFYDASIKAFEMQIWSPS
jgi:spore coat polysaccharide biosynthesis predicted glycosyltransferase SpsG